ncbi:hypothetical protein 000TH008_242 [Bacillus phage 000TH008]|nr:hypothetical protein 000TH008_242 [Bacillus phage 000TH008]
MHLDVVKGDLVIVEWNDEDWKKFRKTIHNLRMQGYRKIGQEADYLNYYEYYRKKGKKKVVTVTMLCM